jgi:hypothetical protein
MNTVRRTAFPRRAAAIRHAHRRLPSIRDLVRKMTWCAEHDLMGLSRANRVFAEAVFAPVRLRDAGARALGAML